MLIPFYHQFENENPENNSKNYVTLFGYQIYNFIFIKLTTYEKVILHRKCPSYIDTSLNGFL